MTVALFLSSFSPLNFSPPPHWTGSSVGFKFHSAALHCCSSCRCSTQGRRKMISKAPSSCLGLQTLNTTSVHLSIFLLLLNDLVSLKNEEQNSTVAQFSTSRLDVQAKMLASIYTLLKSKDLILAADAFSKETNVRHNSSPWLSPLALQVQEKQVLLKAFLFCFASVISLPFADYIAFIFSLSYAKLEGHQSL